MKKLNYAPRLSVGNTISGETNIDTIAKNPLWNPNVHSISDIYLKPEVYASKTAINAIKKSDYIIICPGDLYSSIIPVLLPKGMKKTIKKSKAKIILILNIMTKKGETDNYTAVDFIENIEKRLGRKADYIICNNASISNQVLLKYSLENKDVLNIPNDYHDPRIISVPLAIITKDGQIKSNPKIIQKTIKIILDKMNRN